MGSIKFIQSKEGDKNKEMSLLKSFLYTTALLLILGVIITGCGKDNGETPTPNPPTPPTVDLTAVRGKIATNVGTNIIIPAYENLSASVIELGAAVEDFNAEPTADALVVAQEALKNTWLTWQPAAIYMFGPSEDFALRKSMNTYPTNTNQINTNIESGDYILGSIANQAAVGLPAIDYLLNGLAADNQSIVAAYTDADANVANRKKYLNDLVVDLINRVEEVVKLWTPAGGNHLATFTETDALGIDVGSSLSILVNSIDLHFQRFVRDGKIAIPAGIRSAGVPRPKTIESLYGKYSVELLKESVQAYENLFLGITAKDIDGEGLYDYLVALDAKALADDIKAQFDITQTAIEALSDPLDAQIDTDLEKLTTVFLEMQKIVVFVKSDMVSVTGISITNQDNDGD
jgi:predicted lipoprotein